MQYYIKIFLIVLILCLNTNVYAQTTSDMVKFSPDYIRRLRVCGPHQESIFYNIDADETTYHIKATETIIHGRKNRFLQGEENACHSHLPTAYVPLG